MNKIDSMAMLNTLNELQLNRTTIYNADNLKTGIAAIDDRLGGIPLGRTTFFIAEDDNQRLNFLIRLVCEQLKKGTNLVLFEYNPEQAKLLWWLLMAELSSIPLSKVFELSFSIEDCEIISNIAKNIKGLTIYYPTESESVTSNQMDIEQAKNDAEVSPEFKKLNLNSLNALLDTSELYNDFLNEETMIDCINRHRQESHDNLLVLFKLSFINDREQVEACRNIISITQLSSDDSKLTFLIHAASNKRSRRLFTVHDILGDYRISDNDFVLMMTSIQETRAVDMYLVTVAQSSPSFQCEVKMLIESVKKFV